MNDDEDDDNNNNSINFSLEWLQTTETYDRKEFKI
jgi:hypothetical protein